ncbi:MAG: hypothetical protein HYZ27_12330 [Deltaproteobacteria bacterium]|nr:hypothetical protein [Deltaproteobacteria bacterium]
MRRSWGVGLALAVSCTDADVYTSTGAEPYRPDRLAITGRLCTEDTTSSAFPVKVLVMVDVTQSMFVADPESYRLCGPPDCAPGSIEALIRRNQGNISNPNTNVSMGFVAVSSLSKPLLPMASCVNPDNTPCNPQQFFPASLVDADAVKGRLAVLTDNRPDVLNAISQMESFITADMARATAGEVLRTRYMVYMLFAGAPPDTTPLPEFGKQVERVKNLVYQAGALEFRLEVGHLYYGPRSIDQSVTADLPYQCHPSAGAATCGCGGACDSSTHSPTYCGVCCDLEVRGAGNLETDFERAREIYGSMAFLGDGVYRFFPCPPNIRVDLDQATTSVRLVRKDIVAHNLNVRLAASGSTLDSDGDGLTDSEERSAGTRINHWDSDADSISDRLELRAYPRQNPLDASDRPGACPDPVVDGILDQDEDLLNDCEEGLLQTSRSIPDTDGDGMPDALEFMAGTVPTSADDRLLDYDGDGTLNAQEVAEHTNPRAYEGTLAGAEGYRTQITDIGRRNVAVMEDDADLRAVTFRWASPNVASGPGYLRWDCSARTLEWVDSRKCAAFASVCPSTWPAGSCFAPVAVPIDRGSDVYTLYATNNSTGEQVSIEVFVVEDWLPENNASECPGGEVLICPRIFVSDRACYDVKISNIKLMQTAPATDQLHLSGPHLEGINHVLVFFTQAPENRLSSPGITKLAELTVRFMCGDPDDVNTCARNPDDGFIDLVDSQFQAAGE